MLTLRYRIRKRPSKNSIRERGIEEEYQIIDPETRELRSYITQILEPGRTILREQIKPEMHQSIVEVGTRPCRTISEARAEIRHLRGTIAGLADRHGLKIVAAGTHPFSSWMTQEIFPHERYHAVVGEMQDAALQLLIFGMHCHIGMPNNEVAIELMNVARYIGPHLLAISTSSPFWMGRKTGFKSYRSVVFSGFPRTGTPPTFHSAAEFERYVQLLVSTNCIDNGKKSGGTCAHTPSSARWSSASAMSPRAWRSAWPWPP
jgi:carboxylate-amine ligase